MSEKPSIGFDTVAEFLAHAHALEQELAQRYGEMADSLEVHNNPEVAGLFRQLAKYSETHAGKLIPQAEAFDMPKVPPWEYQWLCIDEPEDCREATNYLMTTRQALQLALRMEEGSRSFYALTIQGSPCQPVKELAEKMVALKERHLVLLNGWLGSEAERHELPPEDLDPPNMPE
ncbi:MAG: ferritin family protein [Pseudomonadota bacterium]